MPTDTANTAIGLGDSQARLVVFAPHRPPLEAYQQLNGVKPMAPGELAALVEATGNHWRKIVNLYAKLLHQLEPVESRWQDCRDQRLLQAGSGCALLFSPPPLASSDAWQLVMGKAYAEACSLDRLADLRTDDGFRWSPSRRLILTPYFDYRALSNARLDDLYRLIDSQRQPE
ncbi:hypothetical protein BGP77_10510 [Saccharospirillum sp. MSK14-1]|uniref:DUF6942 family protein n=1 Tax=Saccharospirillum sp. MSK14-1 TaxID=1897632 RepID=UPI000D35BAB6|nr:hypothetical protein [Saccharospirillum sp. MSK14-1]PTY38608.1 hypothetical protein BGP77_10510 [Saccharospirillum sp. MSK14-1]